MSPQHSGCSSGTQLEKFLSFNLGMMSKPLKLRPRFTIRTATQTCNSGFYTCHAGQVSCNILYYRVNFRTAANCYNHGDRPHGTVYQLPGFASSPHQLFALPGKDIRKDRNPLSELVVLAGRIRGAEPRHGTRYRVVGSHLGAIVHSLRDDRWLDESLFLAPMLKVARSPRP